MRVVIIGVAGLSGVAHAQPAEDLLNKRLPPPGKSQTLMSRVITTPAADVPLRVPDGFRVTLFAEDLSMPREMTVLPNGDVLVGESAAGRIRRLADRDGDGRAEVQEVWVTGLNRPYGIVYREGFVYVANTDSVVRFAVAENGTAGPSEIVIPRFEYEGKTPSNKGHWTRDLLFSRDGTRLFVSVGSESNNDAGEPAVRAAILMYEGKSLTPRLFATGLRNAVSITLRPGTDEIWATVNERDLLGNDLVPDYVTHVREGGFYGWPFYYLGPHPDPRHTGKRPELADKVIVPDVLIQSHSAPLGLAFYDGQRFPEHFRGGVFVGLHGSWNRKPLTGYKVIYQPFRDGKPLGPPEDFLTGFIKSADTGEVYGRPVAPLVLPDGSLLVTDDGANRVWRVAYQ